MTTDRVHKDCDVIYEYVDKLQFITKSIDELLILKKQELTTKQFKLATFISDINKLFDQYYDQYNVLRAQYIQNFINNSNELEQESPIPENFNSIIAPNQASESRYSPLKKCSVYLERLNQEDCDKYIQVYQNSKRNGITNIFNKFKDKGLIRVLRSKLSNASPCILYSLDEYYSKNKEIIELLDKDEVDQDDNSNKTIDIYAEDEGFQDYLYNQIQVSLEPQNLEIENDLIKYLIDEDDEVKASSDISLNNDLDKSISKADVHPQNFKLNEDIPYSQNKSKGIKYTSKRKNRRTSYRKRCKHQFSSGSENLSDSLPSSLPCSDSDDTSSSSSLSIVPNPEEGIPEDLDPDDKNDGRVKGRRNIRKIKKGAQLTQETREAAKAEQERLRRIKENRRLKIDLLNGPDLAVIQAPTELVLEAPVDGEGMKVEVDASIVKHLKPHQVKGITFLYENLVESSKRFQEGDPGGGAILAHLMGLGKTLQVIALVHTLLTSAPFTSKLKTCLIICPQNTCMNWMAEVDKWTREATPIKYWALYNVKSRKARNTVLSDWQNLGGLLIVGYDMFRILVTKSKTSSTGGSKRNGTYLQMIHQALQDPGSDIVVCDEGHMLKNSSTAIFKAVDAVKTRRRIVLTGTPLQNNLYEYHCMVQLIRQNILGSRSEFQNAFVNPIKNGQCADSTEHDVKIMKKRAHILHQKLAGCVQRMDYSALTTTLTSKHEYIILIRLSPKQAQMYRHYLDLLRVSPPPGPALRPDQTPGENTVVPPGANNSKFSVFVDYTNLYSIITHPWLCYLNEKKRERMRNAKLTFSDEETDLDEGGPESDLEFLDSDVEGSVVCSDELSVLETLSEREHSGPDEASTSSKHAPITHNKRVLRSDRTKRKSEKRLPTTTLPPNGPATNVANATAPNLEPPLNKELPESQVDLPLGARDMTKWWKPFLNDTDATNVWLSGKIVMVLEILKEAEAIGDKVLLFSQSLNTLDYLENILSCIDRHTHRSDDGSGCTALSTLEPNDLVNDLAPDPASLQLLTTGWSYGTWSPSIDYFRMDGSTPITTRHRFTQAFNDVSDMRARFFLISTKAGSLGVNLIGASRVIIMDACWNPSHDTQSIFRAYRLGQEKPVFIYRLISQGTIEERIYERQVTKQSLSQRVIDKKQIERHFTYQDLDKLYDFDPRIFQPDGDACDDLSTIQEQALSSTHDSSERAPKRYPLPNVPKDHLLAQLLLEHRSWIVTYHDHDSLLENKVSEELTEEERRLAWEEYENEKRVCGILIKDLMNMITPNGRFDASAIYRYVNERDGPGELENFKNNVNELMTMLRSNQSLILNMISYARTLESLKNPSTQAQPKMTSSSLMTHRTIGYAAPAMTELDRLIGLTANTPASTGPISPVTPSRSRQVGYRFPKRPPVQQVPPTYQQPLSSSGTTTVNGNPYLQENGLRAPAPSNRVTTNPFSMNIRWQSSYGNLPLNPYGAYPSQPPQPPLRTPMRYVNGPDGAMIRVRYPEYRLQVPPTTTRPVLNTNLGATSYRRASLADLQNLQAPPKCPAGVSV